MEDLPKLVIPEAVMEDLTEAGFDADAIARNMGYAGVEVNKPTLPERIARNIGRAVNKLIDNSSVPRIY